MADTHERKMGFKMATQSNHYPETLPISDPPREDGMYCQVRDAVNSILQRHGIDEWTAAAVSMTTASECEGWMLKMSLPEPQGEPPF